MAIDVWLRDSRPTLDAAPAHWIAAEPHSWEPLLAAADCWARTEPEVAEIIRLTYCLLHGGWGDTERHRQLNRLSVFDALPLPRQSNCLDMTLCLIPPGSYVTGAAGNGESYIHDERPAEVTLTKGFWMGQRAVTSDEWCQVMGGVARGADRWWPVTNITRPLASEFCRKLTDMELAAGGELVNCGWYYTLPTEAQWEYACRACTVTPYCCGNKLSRSYAVYCAESGVPGELGLVGSSHENLWGLRDMHGGVWEWCLDDYLIVRPGGVDPVVLYDKSRIDADPFGVLRGGSHRNRALWCRSAYRRPQLLNSTDTGDVGLRVVMVHD